MVELVQTSLVPFLTSLYGTGIPDQAYLWQKYFSLDPRVIAGISAFLDQSRARVRKHLGAKGTGTLERIEKFVRSNGSSERAISQLESTVDTRYIHGDLNSRNLLVPASSKEFVFIDFANSKQDHAMKDIAKLETDLLLLAMDSGQWEDTEWDALDEWGKLVDLYRRGNLLSSSCAASVTTSPKSVQTVARLIQELRRGLRIMLGDGINEREYIVALLHYAMRYLSYPDISLPKKIFTISYVVSDM